jgi:hypothetical protein
MSQQVPRFVWLIAAVAVIGLVAAFGVAWQVASYRTAEEERDCQRAIAARADGRAMWLWIAGAYGEGNPQRTKAFLEELNRRLPELRCVDGDPVPVK